MASPESGEPRIFISATSAPDLMAYRERLWIPAFAGMTVRDAHATAGPCIRLPSHPSMCSELGFLSRPLRPLRTTVHFRVASTQPRVPA